MKIKAISLSSFIFSPINLYVPWPGPTLHFLQLQGQTPPPIRQHLHLDPGSHPPHPQVAAAVMLPSSLGSLIYSSVLNARAVLLCSPITDKMEQGNFCSPTLPCATVTPFNFHRKMLVGLIHAYRHQIRLLNFQSPPPVQNPLCPNDNAESNL